MNRLSKVIYAHGSYTETAGQSRTKAIFRSILSLAFIALLHLVAYQGVDAQTSYEPAPPNTFLNTAYPSNMNGQTFRPATSSEFQADLNSAQAGDTIELMAGVTYTGNFVLPAKPSGTGWIIIRTSNMAGISAEGTRISPSQLAAMPTIETSVDSPAIDAASSAHHYRLVGLNITSGVNVTSALVRLGNTETTTATQPSDIIVDRCYIHTKDNSSAQIKRGVLLNGKNSSVIDSYISNIHAYIFEAKAIEGWNGLGPFKIVNNYLEASGENLMFGGASPVVTDTQVVPSDIEIRWNYFYKPTAWRGPYLVKNLLEFKNGRRALIEGNVLENNWNDKQCNRVGYECGQQGYAVLLKSSSPDAAAPWTVVENINFKNNIVRHTGSAINMAGTDGSCACQQANRIAIRNNLFDDVNSVNWGGDDSSYSGKGVFLKISATDGITIDHNTVFQDGEIMDAYGAASTNFTFTNNITPHNLYGVKGDSQSSGTATINTYLPSALFIRNVIPTQGSIYGTDPNATKSQYPANNEFPATLDDVGFVDRLNHNYRLMATSLYHNGGSDGTDIGANIDAVEADTAGVTAGTPSSALPSPWINQDVGSVGLAGSATYSGGTFTVKGSGADIWGTADGFQFVYQPLSGDGQIVARVVSLQNTNLNAKAGLMIRETLAANSAHVILDYTPNGAFEFMSRSTTGGTTSYLGGVTVTAPYWAKLVRNGNVITAYTSSDGTNWNQTGSTSVTMASNVYVGLIACSHDNTTLTTATFDNASVSALANNPPTVSLTSPANGASFNSPSSITVSANASDSDGSISKVEFYAGTTLIGAATSSPYSITWSNVAAGTYVLKAIATDNAGATGTSSTISITVQTPYGGTAITVPATIEAENFDNGGEGVAYHDTDSTNNGGQYRTGEGVDIQAMTNASNTYDVFNAYAGEWLEYSINVATAGSYNIDAFVASRLAGGTFHIEIDGVNVTGSMTAPTTGAWSTFQSAGARTVSLTAGAHVLRLALDTNGAEGVVADFDRIVITAAQTNSPPAVSITYPANNASLSLGTVTIRATATDSDGTISQVAFYANGNFIGNGSVTGTNQYSFTWGASAGSFALTARATDNAGASTTSTAVNVTVTDFDILLSDNFNDNLRDSNKWNISAFSEGTSAFDSLVSVLEQNSRLEITPRANLTGSHYAGYVSVEAYNLTGRRVRVKVSQTASGNADTIVAVGIDSNNWLRTIKTGNLLSFEQKVNGVKTTLKTITYSATSHLYWRIGHNTGNNLITWQTSSDGVNWVAQVSVSPPFSLTSVRAALESGTGQSVSTVGKAFFDDFYFDR